MPQSTVSVYFGTNRRPITASAKSEKITSFDSELGPISGQAVRFGVADVKVDWNGKDASTMKAVVDKSSLDVADEILTGPAKFTPKLGSRTIFSAIRSDMKKSGRPTLVTIHGFSNDFWDAIERAAWIVTFYGIDANVFAFTWPSRASGAIPLPFVDYIHDRGTAEASGVAIARTIRTLQNYVDSLKLGDWCKQDLHLICHSMGNYALRHGVQALLRLPEAIDLPQDAPIPVVAAVPEGSPSPNRIRRIFDQIILAAPDEDDDAFDDPNKMKYLPRLGNAVTVYHTTSDWILTKLSSVTKFNGPRLGASGPDNMGSISDKVSAVDVSQVIRFFDEPQNHQYYRRFNAVRDDIVAVLKGARQNEIANRQTLGSSRYRLVRE